MITKHSVVIIDGMAASVFVWNFIDAHYLEEVYVRVCLVDSNAPPIERNGRLIQPYYESDVVRYRQRFCDPIEISEEHVRGLAIQQLKEKRARGEVSR